MRGIFDAILFFSPSGVESFFMNNEIDKETMLFSIGKTTAKALQQRVNTVSYTHLDVYKRQESKEYGQCPILKRNRIVSFVFLFPLNPLRLFKTSPFPQPSFASHFSWQGSGIEIWMVFCFFIESISKIILFKKHPLKYKKHIVHCLFNDAPLPSNQTNDTRFLFSIQLFLRSQRAQKYSFKYL